jgi:hypothetical protein
MFSLQFDKTFSLYFKWYWLIHLSRNTKRRKEFSWDNQMRKVQWKLVIYKNWKVKNQMDLEICIKISIEKNWNSRRSIKRPFWSGLKVIYFMNIFAQNFKQKIINKSNTAHSLRFIFFFKISIKFTKSKNRSMSLWLEKHVNSTISLDSCKKWLSSF